MLSAKALVKWALSGLIEAQAGAFVHRMRVTPAAGEPLLGARDEEGGALVQAMQLGKDGATFVHRVMEPPRGGPRPCERALPK